MATLTANLDSSSDIAEVSEPLVVGQTYHLDDEVVIARSALVRQWADLSGLRWLITRGVDNTTKASHLSGATLTVARAFAAGGGAAEAGTVVEHLSGTQTTYRTPYLGDAEPTDPPPVEGDLWVDTTGGLPYQLKVYNGVSWDLMPLVRKDGSIVRASVILASEPGAPQIALVLNDALGDMAYELLIDPESFLFSNADGSLALGINATGTIALSTGTNVLTIGADGAVRLGNDTNGARFTIDAAGGILVSNADQTATIDLSVNGDVSIAGSVGLSLSATTGVSFSYLPTADPVVAGQLWNNAGVVQVSAG